MDLNKRPGNLLWSEIAEPVKTCNLRPAISIEEEQNLPNVLHSINYRYRSIQPLSLDILLTNLSFSREMIEEGYRVVHKNVTFTLHRFLLFPNLAADASSGPTPAPIPPFEDLKVWDPENKWILMAKVRVENGRDQELLNLGMEELLKVQNDMDGCFNLKNSDRLHLDTRVKAGD
jgi:hypothetical protein